VIGFARWILAPVAVVLGLGSFGALGSLAAGDTGGYAAGAFGAVLAAFVVVPRHRVAFAAAIYLAGSTWSCANLVPDPNVSDAPATFGPLACTLAAGLAALGFGVAADRLARQEEPGP